jgi:hypothetical protein
MKKVLLIVLAGSSCALAGVTFDLFNSAGLYSYLEGSSGPLNYTNSGLVAVFSASGGTMHRTSSGFGIDAPGSGDVTYALDSGEQLRTSFDQAVEITNLDFRGFETGEVFSIVIGTATNSIAWDDLSNKTSDSYTLSAPWTVSAGTEIRFAVSGAASVSLDGLTVNVIPEPATMAMLGLGGLLAIVIRGASRK